MSMRERLTSLGLRAGWALGRRLGRRTQRVIWTVGGELAHRATLMPMGEWSRSFAIMTGRPPTAQEVRAAVLSYTRYWVEMLALPGMNARDIDDLVEIDPDDLRALQASVRRAGCVLALGHQANWDLAGAFAMNHDMPVSTVAEILPGEDFGRFLRYRESLGFEIFGHRDRGALAGLADALSRKRLVCLLADRNLARRGVQVAWKAASPQMVSMPHGPAHLANTTGADLRVLTMAYQGHKLHLKISDPIPLGSVEERSQQIAHLLSTAIGENPIDWHVLQPFFSRVNG